MAIHDIMSLVLGFGMVGVLAISFAEKFVPIVPSYVMLMLLGMTADDGAGLSLLVLITALGSLAASLGWFAIGRALGERRVERAVACWGRYVFFKPRTYRDLASSYRRNRFRVTLFAQIVPVARVYMGLPAGVLKLRTMAFAFPAALGILCWNIPFLGLGFVLKSTSFSPDQVGVWASIGLICAEILIFIVVRHLRATRVRDVAA